MLLFRGMLRLLLQLVRARAFLPDEVPRMLGKASGINHRHQHIVQTG